MTFEKNNGDALCDLESAHERVVGARVAATVAFVGHEHSEQQRRQHVQNNDKQLRTLAQIQLQNTASR